MDGKKIKLGDSVDASATKPSVDESKPEDCCSSNDEESGQVKHCTVNNIQQLQFFDAKESARRARFEQMILDLGDVWFSRLLNGMETILPEEILRQIFGYLEYTGDDDLSNCRMVCKSWKTAIDNCPALIRKLVFKTSHIETLCTSTLAGKVRAVSLDSIMSDDQEKLKNLFSMIGENIESVKIDVDTNLLENSQDQTKYRMIFDTLISSCSKLEEISISTASLIIVGASPNRDHLACEEDFKRVKKLTIFHLHYASSEFEIEDVERALGMFPSLTSVRLECEQYGYYFDDTPEEEIMSGKLLDGLITYMKKRPTALQVIDITKLVLAHGDGEKCNKLVLTAIKLSLMIKFIIGAWIFDYDLMKYLLKKGVTLTPDNSWCITSGFIRFDDRVTPEVLAKFGECSHIEKLCIQLYRCVNPGELAFLSDLRMLRKLKLDTFNQSNIIFDFIPTIHFVEVLDISGGLWDNNKKTVSLCALPTCFPNLQEIQLQNLTISEDCFRLLAQLERLTKVKISYCALPDHALAKQLYPRFQSDIIHREDPISLMKNLTKLEIERCNLLTEHGLNVIMKTGRYKMEYDKKSYLYRFEAIVR